MLLLASVAGYMALDRWQRQTIFSVQLGEQRWWREPQAGTEIFDLSTSGQERIRTWYWQHPSPEAPTVLYLHGSRWNLNGSGFRIERWADMGFSVLAIDYRGFGESSPRLPSQDSVREDAGIALQELVRRQADPARRFVYGHSLGAAVAIDLAAQPSLPPPIAGLIVESAFTNIRDMISTTQWADIPGLPLLITQPFDSLAAMARLRTPLLLLHGTADRVVPHTMSDVLLSSATQIPDPLRRLVKIDGASHSNASRSGAIYEGAVKKFVKDAGTAYDHG